MHKAIHELWRPNPSILSLLLTKGISSSNHKVAPKSQVLTGSSDPCFIEGYHLSDPTDGRITLHLKVSIIFLFLKFVLIAAKIKLDHISVTVLVGPEHTDGSRF